MMFLLDLSQASPMTMTLAISFSLYCPPHTSGVAAFTASRPLLCLLSYPSFLGLELGVAWDSGVRTHVFTLLSWSRKLPHLGLSVLP